MLSCAPLLALTVLTSAPTLPAPTADLHVYFGNFHSHTSYSDGSGTPAEAYAHARDIAKLDFLAITEHNHSQAEAGASADRRDGLLIATDHSLYAKLISDAASAMVPGSFVALYGQEFSSISKGNHMNVFDVSEVIDEASVPNGDFKKLHTWLETHKDSAGKPAITQFNHPALLNNDAIEYGHDDFGSDAEWIAASEDHVATIEVLNGPAMTQGSGERSDEIMEADFLAYLNRGFHVGPTGDQDNHYKTWGTSTDARTGVVTDQPLSKDAIFAALRARHVYATQDKNLRVIATVNGHLMGDRATEVPATGLELAISVTISDDDEPDASYRIDVFSDDKPGGDIAKIAETFNEPHAGTFQLSGVNFTGSGQYVFLRVTESATGEDTHLDQAWTAPVWFDGASGAVSTASLRLDSILPNPLGSDTENEAATIRNVGTQPASMSGWTLRDLSRNTWKLDSLGTLAAGASATIVRHGQPMSMNNSGNETIELVAPDGHVVDHISYTSTSPGVAIPHP